MKVEKAKLVAFLKKARMTGGQAINEGILRFEKDGLKFNANSESQQSRVMAWLLSTAFEEYEAVGNVGLNDLENVIKVLERFGDKILLKKEGNLLTVKSEGKSVEIELINEGFLQTDTELPPLEFTDTFDVKAARLHDILKDVTMNKDAVLTIKTAEKSVLFTNTGKYKFSNQLEALTCKGGVAVNMGQPFVDAVDELDGPLQMSVRTDFPCKIIERLDNSVITIIVAPRIESEE